MKSTWSIVNKVINNKKSKNNLQTTFNVDDTEISDPTQIVDHSWAVLPACVAGVERGRGQGRREKRRGVGEDFPFNSLFPASVLFSLPFLCQATVLPSIQDQIQRTRFHLVSLLPFLFFSGAFVNSLYQQPTAEQEILLKFVLVFVQELLHAMTKLR